MSGVVKAAQSSRLVRPAALPMAVAEPVPADERLPAALARIERLEAELEVARKDAISAAGAAREEGHAAGRATAVADDADRLRILETALGDALTAWRDGLAGLDRLAVLVARSALAKLFAAPASIESLVVRAVERRLDLVRHESSRALRLSPGDFADPAALETLRAIVGSDAVAIELDPALPAGACILDLRLGHVDLGPGAQWRLVAELLDQMADGEEGI